MILDMVRNQVKDGNGTAYSGGTGGGASPYSDIGTAGDDNGGAGGSASRVTRYNKWSRKSIRRNRRIINSL